MPQYVPYSERTPVTIPFPVFEPYRISGSTDLNLIRKIPSEWRLFFEKKHFLREYHFLNKPWNANYKNPDDAFYYVSQDSNSFYDINNPIVKFATRRQIVAFCESRGLFLQAWLYKYFEKRKSHIFVTKGFIPGVVRRDYNVYIDLESAIIAEEIWNRLHPRNSYKTAENEKLIDYFSGAAHAFLAKKSFDSNALKIIAQKKKQ